MAAKRRFGTIFRRSGSPKWYIRFHAGRGAERRRYERVGGASFERAELTLRRVRDLLAEGVAVEVVLREVFGESDGVAMTFREAVGGYLTYVDAHRKPNTAYGYRKLLALVCEASWTKKQLDQVTAADITRWVDQRARLGRSPQTLTNYINTCSGVFRWAIERGYVEDNPVRKIRRFSSKGRARETYLSADEARALVQCAPTRMEPLLITALHTGMRRGELLSLRWKSVDLDRGTLTIEAEDAKSGRARTIPMNPVLHAEIRALAVARGSITRKGSEHVFLDEDGSRYTENKLDRDRKKAVEACDLIPTEKKPHVTTHTLRHTAASLMVAAGVPIFDVSKILGHTSVVVTMRYAHFAAEAGRKAVDALGRVLDPGGEADEVREATAPGWSLWLRSGVA